MSGWRVLRVEVHRAKTIGIYAASAALAAASPLLAVPVVATRFGLADWTALAIGQSWGGAGAVLVAYGWALAGPAMVGAVKGESSRRIVRLALLSQLVLFVPTSALCYFLSMISTGDLPYVPGAAAVAACASALIPGWFFIGQSRPLGFLAWNAASSTFGTLAGVFALALGAQLLLLPLIQLVIALIASISLYRVEGKPGHSDSRPISVREVIATYRIQWPYAATQLSSVVYINLPLGIAGLFHLPDLTSVAVVDRVYRLALAGSQPLTQYLQGRVFAAQGTKQRLQRAYRAVRVHLYAGLLGGAVLLAVGPVFSSALFGGDTTAPSSLWIFYSATLAIVVTSRAVGGVLLVQLGKGRALAMSSLSGAAIAVFLIIATGSLLGGTAVALSVLAAECAVLTIQCTQANRRGV